MNEQVPAPWECCMICGAASPLFMTRDISDPDIGKGWVQAAPGKWVCSLHAGIDEDVLRTAITLLEQASYYLFAIIRHAPDNPHTDTLSSIRDSVQREYSAAQTVLEAVKKEHRQ